MAAATDHFVEWLTQRKPKLEAFEVPLTNEAGLDKHYKFETLTVTATVPLKQAKVEKEESVKDSPPRSLSGRQRLLHKHQRLLERGKRLLQQVFGAWFAAQVALDFTDIGRLGGGRGGTRCACQQRRC